MTNIISFPNLGSGTFKLEINPIAFKIGSISIHWYAILLTAGIIAAFLYFNYRAKQSGFSADDALDYTLYTVIFAIIGSRTFYVLTTLENYHSFWDVIAIWNGGLAIYGSIIAGAITMIVISKIKKKSALLALDCVCPAVMLGQVIGRWGNFVNGEAYGSVTEYVFFGAKFRTNFAKSFPWLMGIQHRTAEGVDSMTIVQPTFLYESIWNLIGFLLINAAFKKKKFDGQILLYYLAWYGFGRMFIEGMRTDSLMLGEIRISQLIGLICFLVSATILVIKFIKIRNAAPAGPDTDILTGAERTDEESDEPVKRKSLGEIDRELEIPGIDTPPDDGEKAGEKEPEESAEDNKEEDKDTDNEKDKEETGE